MSDDKPRGIWFFLFGCSPMTTLVLLAILGGLVVGPVILRTVMLRLDPPEPRSYALPTEETGRPWVWIGDRWRFVVDGDDDGTADCLVTAGSGREFFVADGWTPGRCVGGVIGILGRMRGAVDMSPELRDALTRAMSYKTERGWQGVSAVDADADERPDCVLYRYGAVIARRSGSTCPGDELSLPVPLEDHERLDELRELHRLESEIRRNVTTPS